VGKLEKDLDLRSSTRKCRFDDLTASRSIIQHDKPSTGELRPTHIPVFCYRFVAAAYQTKWIVHERLNMQFRDADFSACNPKLDLPPTDLADHIACRTVVDAE
jgi:hypothetical protein